MTASPPYSLPAAAQARAVRERVAPRACAFVPQSVCWLLAITLSVIGISSYGLMQPINETHVFQVEATAPETVELETLSMMELSAPEGVADTLESEQEVQETTTTDLLLEAMTELPETAPPEIALELVPATLTEQDVFEVPVAEELLDLEKLKQPAPPKPVARTAPRSAPKPAVAPARSNGGQPGGTTAGASTAGRSVTKGYFPAPPYPASARSRRLEGTVQLRVTFGTDGRVTSAVVTRSSGYSELDRGASDWVQRRWRGPSGQPGTAQQVIRFKLL